MEHIACNGHIGYILRPHYCWLGTCRKSNANLQSWPRLHPGTAALLMQTADGTVQLGGDYALVPLVSRKMQCYAILEIPIPVLFSYMGLPDVKKSWITGKACWILPHICGKAGLRTPNPVVFSQLQSVREGVGPVPGELRELGTGQSSARPLQTCALIVLGHFV